MSRTTLTPETRAERRLCLLLRYLLDDPAFDLSVKRQVAATCSRMKRMWSSPPAEIRRKQRHCKMWSSQALEEDTLSSSM